MRNQEKIEIPLINIERSTLLIITSFLFSSVILLIGYKVLIDFNPVGFLIMIPGFFMAFQSLWIVLHPFTLIFADRFEIKQSLFRNKIRYFIDIKQVTQNSNGKLYITFNDDEIEKLNLFGIKKNHKQLLKSEIEKAISLK